MGYTGNNVYGYNLAGDYPNNLPEMNLTSSAIDCQNLYGLHLKFMRWLGVESPDYDHAYVRVSNDGTHWTTVWANEAEMTAGSWEEADLDISAIADNQDSVYLRWTMGTTDGGWTYCGWNLDDVQILGVEDVTIGISEPALAIPGNLHNNPNPFTDQTSITYKLEVEGQVSLIIYDMSGRKTRTLVDGYQHAGIHEALWDGADEGGTQLESGIYICTLRTDGQLISKKILMIR